MKGMIEKATLYVLASCVVICLLSIFGIRWSLGVLALPLNPEVISGQFFDYLYDLDTVDKIGYWQTHVCIGSVLDKQPVSEMNSEFAISVEEWFKGEQEQSEIRVIALHEQMEIGKRYFLFLEENRPPFCPYMMYSAGQGGIVLAGEDGLLEKRRDASYFDRNIVLTDAGDKLTREKQLTDYLRSSAAMRSIDPKRLPVMSIFEGENTHVHGIGVDPTNYVVIAKVKAISQVHKYLAEAKLSVITYYLGSEWNEEFVVWVPPDLEVGTDYLFRLHRGSDSNLLVPTFRESSILAIKNFDGK